MIPCVHDARGRESTTLTFTVIFETALVFAFVVSYITDGPGMNAVEFASAFVIILGPWLHREWRERISTKKVGMEPAEYNDSRRE